MEAIQLIAGIDWELLKQQKSSLIEVIEDYDKNYPEEATIVKEKLVHFEGILSLIDTIQDFAADELGLGEVVVFGEELSEVEDTVIESENEIFASANADTIFTIRVESEGLYEDIDGIMSKEFIKSIVDDENHAKAIKEIIRQNILNDLILMPDQFVRDEQGRLTYDYEMYDYGYAIEKYCLDEYNKQFPEPPKAVWVCQHCGSKNIQVKAWVRPNNDNEFIDYPEELGDSECWCDDCEKNGVPEQKEE